jgi:hypothetical protein
VAGGITHRGLDGDPSTKALNLKSVTIDAVVGGVTGGAGEKLRRLWVARQLARPGVTSAVQRTTATETANVVSAQTSKAQTVARAVEQRHADAVRASAIATSNGRTATTAEIETGLTTATSRTVTAQSGRTIAATNSADALGARATEIHGALDPIAQNSRTTAVMSTRQGPNVIASGGRDLSPAQRALTGPGDVLGKLPGAHAEVTAIDAASKAGLTPAEIAASRPICPACQAAITESGGQVSPSGWWAWWPG